MVSRYTLEQTVNFDQLIIEINAHQASKGLPPYLLSNAELSEMFASHHIIPGSTVKDANTTDFLADLFGNDYAGKRDSLLNGAENRIWVLDKSQIVKLGGENLLEATVAAADSLNMSIHGGDFAHQGVRVGRGGNAPAFNASYNRLSVVEMASLRDQYERDILGKSPGQIEATKQQYKQRIDELIDFRARSIVGGGSNLPAPNYVELAHLNGTDPAGSRFMLHRRDPQFDVFLQQNKTRYEIDLDLVFEGGYEKKGPLTDYGRIIFAAASSRQYDEYINTVYPGLNFERPSDISNALLERLMLDQKLVRNPRFYDQYLKEISDPNKSFNQPGIINDIRDYSILGSRRNIEKNWSLGAHRARFDATDPSIKSFIGASSFDEYLNKISDVDISQVGRFAQVFEGIGVVGDALSFALLFKEAVSLFAQGENDKGRQVLQSAGASLAADLGIGFAAGRVGLWVARGLQLAGVTASGSGVGIAAGVVSFVLGAGLSYLIGDQLAEITDEEASEFFAELFRQAEAGEEIDPQSAAERLGLDLPAANYCFAAGTEIRGLGGSIEVVENIKVGHQVDAFNADARSSLEQLSVRRVTAVHVTTAKHLLDFHGTRVTPGHVFLRGDGQFQPLLEIIRADGAVVDAEGQAVRACTNFPVGSREDQLIEILWIRDSSDRDMKPGTIRAGTWLPKGTDGEAETLLAMLERSGYRVLADGKVQAPNGAVGPLHWFGEPPKPHDYLIHRSGYTSIDELYDDPASWEGRDPRQAASAMI